MCQYVITWGKKQSIESNICLKKTLKGEFGGKPTKTADSHSQRVRFKVTRGHDDSFDVKDQTDPELKLEKGPDRIY